MRRNFTLFALSLAAAAALPASALAQPKPVKGITIVIPINALGTSREASVKAMKSVVEIIRKQPGLMDEVLMESKNPDSKPSHVHVLHWRTQKDWEAVFANPEFQKAIQANSAYLAVAGGAGIYTPVK